MTATETGDLLELRHEVGGLRYYLAGEGIHAGAILELVLDDGRWVLGRYEWNCRPENRPFFIVDTESGDTIVLDPERSRLRWPEHTR